MISKSRVTILVKASPQPSKTHAETVCCAGLEADGSWKRLFPIRFRRLNGDKSFRRWDIVEFEYSRPRDDARSESCRVHEESINISGRVKSASEKSSLVERAIVESEKKAAENGQSLALIRPTEPQFLSRRREAAEVETMRQKFAKQARQLSLLEDEIAAYEPCPFEFSMKYNDADGTHKKLCADWETSAAFFNLRRSYPEKEVLQHLEKEYCETYLARGLVFALGNIKRRPQTWQLLGIFPVEETAQSDLFS